MEISVNDRSWRISPRKDYSQQNLGNFSLLVSETPKGVQSVNTKAVFGVAVAPFNDHHVASFVDNTIAIWDMRSFDKPLLALGQKKHIIKINWCPTRYATFLFL